MRIAKVTSLSAPHVIRGKRAVAYGHRGQTSIIKVERYDIGSMRDAQRFATAAKIACSQCALPRLLAMPSSERKS